MLNPLDALVITFGGMSVVSVLGVVLMNLVKKEKMKKGLLYAMSAWGLIVTGCNILSIGGMSVVATVIAVLLGALSVAAVIVDKYMKKENSFKLAKTLATVSVVAGMVDCFMIW